MIPRIILFLVLNFAALAIGGMYTNEGVRSLWYEQLEKAPWTPPGWVFGFAWTTIMVCFAVYISMLWNNVAAKKTVIVLYVVQWILNVAWNPVFFKFHLTGAALVIIALLTMLISGMLFWFRNRLRLKSLFIAPYWIWLLIATSLNAYIYLYNA